MFTAAVVTPESYQTLAYFSAQCEWSEPLCVGISTWLRVTHNIACVCHNFLVRIPARVSLRAVRVQSQESEIEPW